MKSRFDIGGSRGRRFDPDADAFGQARRYRILEDRAGDGIIAGIMEAGAGGSSANCLGFAHFSGFQLKIIQEVITMIVFIVFALTFLKEKLAWNYVVAFGFLAVAAFFAFKAAGPASWPISWTPCEPIPASILRNCGWMAADLVANR